MTTFPYKTTASVRVVDGVQFYAWHVAIMHYERRSEDGRAAVGYNGANSTTYWGRVDDITLGRRYRTQETAMRTCVRYMKRRKNIRPPVAAADKTV